jgi:hypothetical protein
MIIQDINTTNKYKKNHFCKKSKDIDIKSYRCLKV